MKKDPDQRVNIIGAGEATVVDLDKNNIHNVNNSFWYFQDIKVINAFGS